MKHGGNIYAIARELGKHTNELIDFSANINPLGFPRGLSILLRRAHSAILNYPDPDAFDCTAALAHYHKLPHNYILPGNGSTELIYLLPDILKPRRVLIVTPTFTEYVRSYQYRRVSITPFPTEVEDRFLPDVKLLQKRLHRGICDVLYLCNPGNPSGALIKRNDMTEIVHAANANNITVVLDEAFMDFTETHSMKSLVKRFNNLIVLRSLTKFFGIPGLRFGYLIANPDIITAAKKRCAPWSINALAQSAAVAVLKNRSFIEKTRTYVSKARKGLFKELKNIQGLEAIPGHANFILIRLKHPHITAPQLFQKLLHHNIIIRTCEDFEGLDETFFRIAVKKHRQNMQLVTALKKILAS
ncbi:MAG: threonine-phosphate decarboxylase CobD [Desulfobacterota bacterium]|nr:threonine-phosphate decarboxylase CobD [Thermodesulfobacteriota bacterium]